jgi:hypothetical protein
MTDNTEQYKATFEEWASIETRDTTIISCLLELRDRVETLEGKYETLRLATVEWGKDVDKLKRWSDQHLQRIMALEANSKPTPNPSQIRSSLVERLRKARHTAAVLGNDQDRAAIREVAAALIEWDDSDQLIRTASDVANWLEQEAGR